MLASVGNDLQELPKLGFGPRIQVTGREIAADGPLGFVQPGALIQEGSDTDGKNTARSRFS
jgi:hypothetical protein